MKVKIFFTIILCIFTTSLLYASKSQLDIDKINQRIYQKEGRLLNETSYSSNANKQKAKSLNIVSFIVLSLSFKPEPL